MNISMVSVIDDQEEARIGSIELLEDLGIRAQSVEGPLGDIDSLIKSLSESVDGVICDYKLGIRNYAHFDGDLIVSRLYEMSIPSILCTKFDHSANNHLVTTRMYIPSIINPEDLNEESLYAGFQQCIDEFSGLFVSSRVAHRTLITIEDVGDDGNLFVLIPAWKPNETISIRRNSLPTHVINAISNDQQYFHTRVNIGCDDVSDLFFDSKEWEVG